MTPRNTMSAKGVRRGWSLAETTAAVGLLALGITVLLMTTDRAESRFQRQARHLFEAAAMRSLLGEVNPAHAAGRAAYGSPQMRARLLPDGSPLFYRREIAVSPADPDHWLTHLSTYPSQTASAPSQTIARESARQFRGLNLGQPKDYVKDALGRTWTPSRQAFRGASFTDGWRMATPPRRYGPSAPAPMGEASVEAPDARLYEDGEEATARGEGLRYAFVASSRAQYRLTLGVAEMDPAVGPGDRAMRIWIDGADRGALDAMPRQDSRTGERGFYAYEVSPREARKDDERPAIIDIQALPAPGARYAPRLAWISLTRIAERPR